MGKFHETIQDSTREFIAKQHMFFVATAPLASEGHINLSPKGLDAFKILSPTKVAYMDLIGSGNETAAHILENKRITFMFCSFDKVPNILRLYGKGYSVTREDTEWEELSANFIIYPSTRQIIVADIFLIQNSCGYGIPFYEYQGERHIHFDWAEKKGEQGLEDYKKEKNLVSLDGLSTGLPHTQI